MVELDKKTIHEKLAFSTAGASLLLVNRLCVDYSWPDTFIMELDTINALHDFEDPSLMSVQQSRPAHNGRPLQDFEGPSLMDVSQPRPLNGHHGPNGQ